MSAVILITGAISGSIILLYSQWQVIKKGHPWVGMLLGPSFLLICWLFVKFILMPNPKDCDGVSCEWAGVFMVFSTLYLIANLFLSTINGVVAKIVCSKKAWTELNNINEGGKIIYFVISEAAYILAFWYLFMVKDLFIPNL